MITIVQANGAALQTDMTIADFQALMIASAPSSWIQLTEVNLGSIYLNTFVINYYFQA